MAKVRFAVIGGGGRSHQYLRIAIQLPELFEVSSVFVRDPEKREKFTQEWGVPTSGTLEEMLASKPKFVVVSVTWEAAPVLTKELCDRGIPVLSETPPAPNVEALVQLYQETDKGRMIQVAEQIQQRPNHLARVLTAESGLLGNITEAQVSVSHGYHGIGVMRKLLGVNFEPVKIVAKSCALPAVVNRDGSERTAEEHQTLAWLDFEGKLGVFDFTFSQYRIPIRTCRVLVRGDRGEIHNATVRYMEKDNPTAIVAELVRHEAVSDCDTDDCKTSVVSAELYGWDHAVRKLKGITLGDKWMFRNPFFPADLSDDQVAVATFLQRMGEYVDGGPSFYSLAEASQDHYLGMMIDKAAETGMPVVAEPQVWSR